MENKKLIFGVLIALIAGIVFGYGYGKKSGYARGDAAGFARAEADLKKVQTAAGQKATNEAAKAANPFQAANPLQSVQVNPFEKAKKVLNPF